MRIVHLIWIFALIAVAIGGVWSMSADAKSDAKSHPQELGTIEWMRDLDEATTIAKRDGKPLLVLFQEVPGCSTCVGYGQQVLAHPLVHEAIESLFIPVAIYNNTGGADARWLKTFGESAFNNPVVRIMSSDHHDLAPRVADDYSINGIVVAMVTALEGSKHEIPTYLRLLASESSAKTERATFAMPCFWSGEAYFDAIDGVIATKPGYLDGKETVDVDFDPAVIPFEKLLNGAIASGYADHVFTRTDEQQRIAAQRFGARSERTDDLCRPDESPKFYLSQTPLKFLPMTRTQACRVNAAVHAKGDWMSYLSPRQIDLYHTIESHPDAGWADATHSAAFASLWRDAVTKK